jgi:Bacterial regulatory proteins, luxR family
VLQLLAAGQSDAQIARRLGASVHTVERHVANLYPKIGARGRADAAPVRGDDVARVAAVVPLPFATRFPEMTARSPTTSTTGSGPTLLFVSAGQWSFVFRDRLP